MKLSEIFPSFFAETAAQSITLIGARIEKIHSGEGIKIIAAEGKPVEWFFSYLQAAGYDSGAVIGDFDFKGGEPGTLFVWSKYPEL